MNLRYRVFVAVGLIAGAAIQARAGWQTEPVDLSGQAGYSLYLDSDAAGTVQAAFYTTSPNGDLRYARRGAAGWQVLADVPLGKTFAVDNSGNRFFVSPTSPNFYPQYQILLDNGMILQQQVVDKKISTDVFLDFDSQNRPQIGYVDPAAQQLKLASWNGTSWTTSTVASGTEFQYANSSFIAAIDSADQVHFAWKNSSNVLRYADPVSSSSWQITSPFPTLNASPLDMKVDSTGRVHLAYDVFTGMVSTGGLFYSLDQAGSWTGGRIPGLDGFGAEESRLVLDAQGAPHIFTYDGTFSGPDVLKHLSKVNGNWTSEAIASFANTSSGPEEISALADAQGLHVLYSNDVPQVYYSFKSYYQKGDFNRDGSVNAADVKAMLAALTDINAYKIANNLNDDQWKAIADIDGSGTVTNGDMQGLLSMLINGGGSSEIVPEPAAVVLLASGVVGVAVFWLRKRPGC